MSNPMSAWLGAEHGGGRSSPEPPLVNDLDKNSRHEGSVAANHVGVGKGTQLECIGAQS